MHRNSRLIYHGKVLRDWIQRQIIVPIIQLLRQGITPEKIALSIAFGAVLGSMPAIGVTTTLCLIIAYLLRLNPVAIQLVNYLMYPVQLALFLPFIRVGEIVFRQRHLVITVNQIEHLFSTNMAAAIRLLWTSIWHAVTVWAALAPLAIAIIYICLTPVLKRMASRSSSARIES
jgi:uncharacterized protein (DUF2062 family)